MRSSANVQNISADRMGGPERLPSPPRASTSGTGRFPQHYINPRFCLTPQNIGMNANLTAGSQLTGVYANEPIIKVDNIDFRNQYRSERPAPAMHMPTSNQPIREDNIYERTMAENRSNQENRNLSTTTEYTSLTSFTRNPVFSAIVPTLGQKLTSFLALDARTSQMANAVTNCVHPSHNVIQTVASLKEIPTDYYEKQLEKYCTASDMILGDTAKMNGQLNEIFLRRLQDIDNNAKDNSELKLVTYQEWVDMLLKINESLINNMEDLQLEVTERLDMVQQCMYANYHQIQGNELMKCRQDINTLIKIIQNGYHNDSWDFKGISFETISPAQVLGVADKNAKNVRVEGGGAQTKNNGNESTQQNKLFTNIRALAFEVAEKYDETRMLKEHIACIEHEIQNAQKKIQLKDDVIRELRNDLKSTNAKLTSRNSEKVCLGMPPVNLDDQQTARSGTTQLSEYNPNTFIDDCSQFDSLSLSEVIEKQKLKLLEDELNEFFEINKECNKQKVESHRKRLSELFQKTEAEKADAYRKLDSIRRKLIDLETTSVDGVNDGDSGFGSKSENDRDFKILESVRNRLRKLNDANFDLKKRVQKLELENNELATNLKAEKTYSECNSQTLREVADLLCSMINKQFSYTDIYNSQCETNPFCDALMQMKNQYEKQEAQLLNAVAIKNKKIEELNKSFLESEKQFGEERRNHVNESLKCHIEHLQDTITEREQRIMQLSAMLTRITQEQGTSETAIGNTIGNAIEYGGKCELAKADDLEKKIEYLTSELSKSIKEQHFLHLETRKLNEELNESKRKNNNLLTQTQRLSSLLKAQETHRTELACKYEALDKNFEEQSKKLRAANTQLSMLNDRFHLMEKRQSEHNIECNLLREEVLALKEKEADLMSKQKSIQEQLINTEKELFTAHDVIKEQQCILQNTELAHRDVIKRLQETNSDIKQKMASIVEDYKRLEEEYEKQREICSNNDKLIESFRKWKEAQQKIEERTRDTFRQYEDHIRLLLQEKQRFVEEYRDLHKDYNIIQNELDRLRICSYNMSGCNPTQRSSERSIGNPVEVIREVTRRLSQQSFTIREENPSSNYSLSTDLNTQLSKEHQ